MKLLPTTNLNKGIYFAILAAVISGFSIFINKFAVDAVQPPLYFVSVKNLMVGLLIFVTLVATKKLSKLNYLSRRELKYLFLIGIIGGALPFYLFFTGLSSISALNGALIQKTMVIWVILLAVPFLKEKLSKKLILGVLFLFAGNLLVGGFKGFTFSQGEFFVLLATILWAVENILAKKVLPTVEPTIVTFFRMGFGSLILIATSVATIPNLGAINLSSYQFIMIALTVLSLFLYVTTWYQALKNEQAITVSAILVSSTLVTNVLSAIFVTHSWDILLTVQALFIVAGLVVVSKIKVTSLSHSQTL